MDTEDYNAAVSALIYYLEEAVGKEFDENREEYREFSDKFVELYRAAYPKDESVHRGDTRPTLKHTFVNNHLVKVSEKTSRSFTLQRKDGNVWVLEENLSAAKPFEDNIDEIG